MAYPKSELYAEQEYILQKFNWQNLGSQSGVLHKTTEKPAFLDADSFRLFRNQDDS